MGEVVITGGTGGLGAAVVDRMLAEGADVHVTWLFEKELEHFSRADDVTLHKVDCAEESQVTALYGGLSGCAASIHIVGGFAMAPLTETSGDDLDGMLRLNVRTAFLCCREAIRSMRGGGGRIVNVAARPAVVPTGGMVAYATSKGAVASLTQSAAEEVRAEGILINAVLPSIMDTPGNRAAMPDADFDSWPKVAEVAEAIAFLASTRNALTTGALLPVYGRS